MVDVQLRSGRAIPLAYASLSCTHPTSTCSIVATGWLDLDDAEAQNPGALIGEPLDVNVSYTHVYTTDGAATVRILASLLKK